MVSSGVSTIGHRYEIPALLTEVAPQEGLLQAFDSLQTLDAVIADVFNRIQNRINEEKGKIGAVVERVGRAQAKVAEIGANANRVTTIFSTAKYPAPRVLPDFKRVIEVDPVGSMAIPAENKGLFLPVVRTQHRISSKERFAPAPPADTSALFASLTGARLMRTEHQAADEETEIAEGLGRLPAYLPSISSVLLFNSDENPYKQYVTINNLEGVGGQDRVADSTGPSAAPKSLIDGLELPTYAGFTFDYKPIIGELPQFDLPQNLPLGKLADISFGVDSSLSIAPSVAGLALPSLDLPALPMPARPAQQSAVPSNLPGTSSSQTSTSAPSITSAPAAAASVPKAPPAPAAPVVSSSAPPPPPGPPPAAPANIPAAVAKPSGGRGALLDAIRDQKNAKRLRSVKAGSGAPGAGRPTGGKKPVPKKAGEGDDAAADRGAAEETEKKKPPPSADSGDMMSALREQLARRRAAATTGNAETPAEAKPVMAARRPSVAPRLGGATPASLVKGKTTTTIAESAAGEEAEDKEAKMSSAVLSAYVSAHAKKQEKEDDWE